MASNNTLSTRYRAGFEFAIFAALGIIVKLILDQISWRYSGPISLAVMLILIVLYIHKRGQTLASIGLVRLSSRKNYLWLFPQFILGFITIMAAGLGVAYGGEALGFDFMKPDPAGAEDRFGAIAGNTPLYLMWIAIICFASPAEELYFRGFFINKLRDVFGMSGLATAASIILPAIIFGIGHVYYLGLRGFFITGAIGCALGLLFVLYKRNIWPLMFSHAAFNMMTFTAIYLDLDI